MVSCRASPLSWHLTNFLPWHSPNSVDKYYFEIDQINFDLTLFIG